MDDIVKQAMAKWPDVPAVYGWLGLDRRGNWLIKGERISNPVVADFIGRNYERGDDGCWFFQNGPQRVFVALDYTPFVYRLDWAPGTDASPRIEAHTGSLVREIESAWIDDAGIVLLATEHGTGMMDDRDLERLMPCFVDFAGAALAEETIADMVGLLQAGGNSGLNFLYRGRTVPVAAVAAAEVPAKFGFIARPVQPAGAEKCG